MVHWGSELAARAGDRAAVGVAHVRDRLRRGRRRARRSHSGTDRREREVYLLSALSDASVKLREGLVDVKRLERVGDDGLELWMPVMKAAFPLSGEEAAAVLAELSASAPTVGRTEYAARGLRERVGCARSELARRLGAEATYALPRRRVHGRVDRHRHRCGRDPHHRDRITRSRARIGDRRPARARWPRKRQHGPRTQAPGRVRRPPERGDRCRHELSEVLCGGAPNRRNDADDRRPGRRHTARRRSR